ncbi:MAG: hypothetical protein M3179_06310 [Actinomycetota bacterium]|nr:hypothetical protein [Actinomycetota bacterium]
MGQESYRTDVNIANNGGSPQAVVVFRAGPCFLQDSDTGFGAADPGTGRQRRRAELDRHHRPGRLADLLPSHIVLSRRQPAPGRDQDG